MTNGKAQLQKTNVDVMSLLQKNKREIYGYLRQQGSASPQSEITPNNGGNQYTPVVTNFLKQSGGSMYGPFAWGNVAAQNNQALADNLIIKKGDGKGHLDVSTSGVYGSYASVFLDPVSWFPASVVGSLSFIDNATWDGQTLKISLPWLSNSGSQFTLNNDGNILFNGSINNVFTQQVPLLLTFTFDSSVQINGNTGGTWILDYISPQPTSGSGANTQLSNLVSPVEVNENLNPQFTNNVSVGTASLSWSDMWTYILNIHSGSQDPVSNGEMRTNGNDCKVFSGGAVRNFTDMAQDVNSYRIPLSSGQTRWYTAMGSTFMTNGTTTPVGINQIYFIPFIVGKQTVIDGLGIYVTNVSTPGTVLEMGIYTDNGNLLPANLVSGSDVPISVSAAGALTVTGLSMQPFKAGQVIWLAVRVSFSGITTVGLNSAYMIPILGISASDLGHTTNPSYGYVASFSGGSLPSNMTGISFQYSFFNMPAVHIRVNSQL